jgi:CubicO group peptidase (beta-lactamase class C family)
MARLRVPGVAVGLLHEDHKYLAGIGVTNTRHPLPVTPDTLFQIGSITKTFTATAAMRLVETGHLDLDTPVRQYVPELALADETVAARVTMRHLFTHTGGWVGDYFDDLGRGDDARARYVARMVDLAQLTPLGTVWSYNNSGFVLAGRVLEVITRQPYDAIIKELVLDPLGMETSGFFAEDAILHRVAVGHNITDEQEPEIAAPWAVPRCAVPAGGLLSTARDMLRYARFHRGDGTTAQGSRLLGPASMAFMQSPLAPAGSMADAVGVSWLLREWGVARTVGHGGATNGQTATLTMLPAHGFALVILTNANRGDALYREVTRWALAHYLGLEPPRLTPLAVPADQLRAFAGEYSSTMTDRQVVVEDEGLRLTFMPKGGFPRRDSPPLPAPPPLSVVFVEPDRIAAREDTLDGLRGEFLRDADGRIAWLRVRGRIHARKR